MSLILALETATPVCSVALARDGEILSLRESVAPNAHSSVLTIFIENLFREANLRLADLDAVSVSMGPGSYTGLRIGVAAAKGLCYALGKPLIAIPTLEAMAAGMRDEKRGTKDEFRPVAGDLVSGIETRNPKPETLFCPMIDARRMEVYCAVFDQDLKEIRSTEALVLDTYSFTDLLVKHPIFFAGTGAEKCREILAHDPNAQFLDNFQASARFMIPLSEIRYREKRFEDLAYFEPFYLKDFIAGKPRVKGLN